MRLRQATEDDLPALVRLSATVQDLHARHQPAHINRSGTVPGCLEMFRQALGNTAACLVVAENEGTVIGCFFAQELQREENWVRPAQLVFVLEHIAVEPTFRRNGIGRALMERFLAEAHQRGIPRTELVCWDFNKEAQLFFNGFRFEKLHSRYERGPSL